MRHLGLGVGLFSIGTVVSASLWYANSPEFSLGQPTYSTAIYKKPAIDEIDFIKKVKASLKEEVLEPPAEQHWLLQNASLSKGTPMPPVKSRGSLVKTGYGGSYGVNEEFIKRACLKIAKR